MVGFVECPSVPFKQVVWLWLGIKDSSGTIKKLPSRRCAPSHPQSHNAFHDYLGICRKLSPSQQSQHSRDHPTQPSGSGRYAVSFEVLTHNLPPDVAPEVIR
jgi:hypothetical protein